MTGEGHGIAKDPAGHIVPRGDLGALAAWWLESVQQPRPWVFSFGNGLYGSAVLLDKDPVSEAGIWWICDRGLIHLRDWKRVHEDLGSSLEDQDE